MKLRYHYGLPVLMAYTTLLQARDINNIFLPLITALTEIILKKRKVPQGVIARSQQKNYIQGNDYVDLAIACV